MGCNQLVTGRTHSCCALIRPGSLSDGKHLYDWQVWKDSSATNIWWPAHLFFPVLQKTRKWRRLGDTWQSNWFLCFLTFKNFSRWNIPDSIYDFNKLDAIVSQFEWMSEWMNECMYYNFKAPFNILKQADQRRLRTQAGISVFKIHKLNGIEMS